MCDPLTIGTMAASTGANYLASRDVNKAREGVLSAEGDRAAAFQGQGDAAVNDGINASTRTSFDKSALKSTAKRNEGNQSVVSKTANFAPGQGDAPKVVQRDAARTSKTRQAQSSQQGAARAKLDGFGDAVFGGNVTRNRTGQRVAQSASDAARSAAIVPLELQAANQAGNTKKLIGDILAGASMASGAVGGVQGIQGMFGAPGGSPTQIGRLAARNGLGPYSYVPPHAGVPGSAVYTRPLPPVIR